MRAIAKTRPAAGVEIIEVDEPAIRPGHVKVKVEHGSVCGTDLHIYNWDAWSANRIHPPRIIGHEFCGTIVEVASDVTDRKVGDFISSESHIVCGHCLQCRSGQKHVCVNTRILGVDVDGGFSPLAVIPWENARLTPSVVPRNVASFMDALGNGVHTAMAGPIEGRSILITGLGPIGLFAAAICKCLGARKVYGTEVSDYRLRIAEEIGVDCVFNPMKESASAALRRLEPDGVDATLEMSGHPSSVQLAIDHTRPGGRISFLGVFPDRLKDFDINQMIFKGIDAQGIVGRKLYETWDQMNWLLTEKGLNVLPVVTHEIPFEEIEKVFETLKAGGAGKIVIRFDD